MLERSGCAGRVLGAAVVMAVVVLLAPRELRAQAPTASTGGFTGDTYLAAGYTINAPNQRLGVSLMTIGSFWKGWGLYLDAKKSTGTPEGEDSFDPSRTATDVARNTPDDQLFVEESAWRSLNGAVVRAVGSEFAVYAGGGVTEESAYDEYRDWDQRATADAFYWVEDEVSGGTEPNVLGGVFFRATRNLIFQAGGELNPPGFTVGAALGLPLGG